MTVCPATAAANNEVYLKCQEYGKDRVRLVKVIRPPNSPRQYVVDYSVRTLLDGDFETSYTKGSNAKVVATDTQKNTVYVLAKQSTCVETPELFAYELAQHFVTRYPHVNRAKVSITSRPWERLALSAGEHPHSFVRAGKETRTTTVTVFKVTSACGGQQHLSATIESGFSGLEVLKSTGSAFTDFMRDEYTTLPEMKDRILSTMVESSWKYNIPTVTVIPSSIDFNAIYNGVRLHTLETFSYDEPSASVQATLYKMAAKILGDFKAVDEISYALPNIHIFPVDLAPFGLDNKGRNASVYMPIADPSGRITATIARRQVKQCL
ncbi:urate oxidase [Ramicandelaber brevisporus]|nr:urate oxidase [Ramicandelaber brevisporus]